MIQMGVLGTRNMCLPVTAFSFVDVCQVKAAIEYQPIRMLEVCGQIVTTDQCVKFQGMPPLRRLWQNCYNSVAKQALMLINQA